MNEDEQKQEDIAEIEEMLKQLDEAEQNVYALKGMIHAAREAFWQKYSEDAPEIWVS